MTYTMKAVTVDPFFVESDTFPDSWKNGSDYQTTPENFEKLVEFVNRCLCVYWKSLKNIHATTESDTILASQLKRRLDDLASVGWGRGISDLNEALAELDRLGFWTDNNISRYYGGKDQLYDKHVYAPSAFVEFANAFDKKIAQLKGDYREHIKLTEAAMADADRDSWVACKEKLKKVKEVADKVKDHTWLLDAYAIGGSQATQDFMATTGRYLGTAGKSASTFVDVVGRIDAVLSMYEKMRIQLGQQQGAEETAQVFAALRAVVDFLPVIGGFYAAMLDAIPGVIDTWNKTYIAHLKTARLINDNNAEFMRRMSLPDKKPCKHCGKLAQGVRMKITPVEPG